MTFCTTQIKTPLVLFAFFSFSSFPSKAQLQFPEIGSLAEYTCSGEYSALSSHVVFKANDGLAQLVNVFVKNPKETFKTLTTQTSWQYILGLNQLEVTEGKKQYLTYTTVLSGNVKELENVKPNLIASGQLRKFFVNSEDDEIISIQVKMGNKTQVTAGSLGTQAGYKFHIEKKIFMANNPKLLKEHVETNIVYSPFLRFNLSLESFDIIKKQKSMCIIKNIKNSLTPDSISALTKVVKTKSQNTDALPNAFEKSHLKYSCNKQIFEIVNKHKPHNGLYFIERFFNGKSISQEWRLPWQRFMKHGSYSVNETPKRGPLLLLSGTLNKLSKLQEGDIFLGVSGSKLKAGKELRLITSIRISKYEKAHLFKKFGKQNIYVIDVLEEDPKSLYLKRLYYSPVHSTLFSENKKGLSDPKPVLCERLSL